MTDTIVIIDHRASNGQRFVWVIAEEHLKTIVTDLCRYCLDGLLGIDEALRICDKVGKAMVKA